MAFEQLEPVLYLPDDTSFYADIGDEFHTARLAWRAAGLVGLALLVFLPTMWAGGFVWQDDWHVSQNVLLWSWTGLARTWSHGLGGVYRPLAQSFLWAEHHFRGQSPTGYHVVSVLLHGADSILLWMVLRRLGIPGAWLAAALFCVHPVQVQAVAWISQQSHLLSAGLCMGAVWAFLRLNRMRPAMPVDMLPGDITDVDQLMDPEPVAVLYAVATGLAILAVLSDSIALVLPLVLLVLVWWKRGAISREIWLQLAPFFAIAAAGAVVFFWVGSGAADPGGIAPTLSVLQRILVASRAIWAYAMGILWPHPLLFVYPRWNVSTADGFQYLYPIGLVLVIVIGWVGRKWWGRGPLAAVLLFLILLLPALWLILGSRAPSIYLADHLQYAAAAVPLALIASAIVAVISWVPISSPIVLRSTRAAAGIACLVPLGVIGWVQGLDYSDGASIWKATLAQDPYVVVARTQYAILLVRAGRPLDAADLLRDAPPGDKDVVTLQTWGKVYSAQGRFPDAVDSYAQARKLDPDNRELAYELASALTRAGRIDEALQLYEQELARNPNDDSIYNSMGQIFMAQGKKRQAIAMYEAGLKVNPRSIGTKINYANVLFETGRPKEAADQLQQVVALDPSYFATFVVAATMQMKLRDFAGAEQNCRLALTLNPKSAEAWNDLGVAQCNENHVREAIISFQKAIQCKPDYAEARQNLDLARQNMVSAGR